MFVSFVCCVVSGLCDKLITRSDESYRLCVSEGDLEITTMKQPWPKLSCCATGKKVWCVTVKTKLWMAMFPATLTLVVNRQSV